MPHEAPRDPRTRLPAFLRDQHADDAFLAMAEAFLERPGWPSEAKAWAALERIFARYESGEIVIRDNLPTPASPDPRIKPLQRSLFDG